MACRAGRPVSDDIGDELVDHDTRVLQLLRIIVFGRVELRAVAATDAVTESADLVQRGVAISLGGPLPGILSTVAEEDVGSSGVDATLIDRGLTGLGVVGHVEAAEDLRAVIQPVLLVDD